MMSGNRILLFCTMRILTYRHYVLYSFYLLLSLVSATAAFRTQSAAVKGVLMCGDKPLADTKVKLWDNDAGPDLDDLLEEGHTDSQGRFHLSGHTSELTTIDPILKIYHDCDDGIMPCQRKVSFIIPDSYVSSGGTPTKTFDIGTVNMQIVFKAEERDCLNR
ncbi:hypothetical protein L596_025126 [Steinernema carpocapsae]|uniref:Transthyretin-like family protein n=1 Tax=Steinernema carpocapsae TaxID=34508 RepID=A0A4U5M6W7_STECR|nr:hypothetical protein L596_025126 [Steinernema carpocapsae]